MTVTTADTYDVAVIGYGPTGATAANLLGQLGLKVLVVERDPDVYGRARAISTDEEVMRVWQSVGLADRLQQDMLPDRPLNFVDADGVPFIDLKITSRGTGHPPQQFLYQPAVDHVLREGVARFPNVEVLLEHECLRVLTKGDEVELMLADLRTDTFKRFRASYVIAAEGGSSPTRGQLGVGYSGPHLRRTMGRHRHQGAEGVGRPRPAAVPLQPRPSHGRLPDPTRSPPMGVPRAHGRG